MRLIADLFDAPLVTAVRVARDRSEVESLAIAGGLGDCSPERWKGRHALTRGSATWAAVDADEAVRVGDFSRERLYRPGPIARSAAARSVACVPIAGGAGCLAVCHTEANGVSDEELELLEAVARLLSKRWPASPRRAGGAQEPAVIEAPGRSASSSRARSRSAIARSGPRNGWTIQNTSSGSLPGSWAVAPWMISL